MGLHRNFDHFNNKIYTKYAGFIGLVRDFLAFLIIYFVIKTSIDAHQNFPFLLYDRRRHGEILQLKTLKRVTVKTHFRNT